MIAREGEGGDTMRWGRGWGCQVTHIIVDTHVEELNVVCQVRPYLQGLLLPSCERREEEEEAGNSH